VTDNGYGKRTDLDAYRPQSRNGKGLIDIKTNERNGPVCAINTVGEGDHLVVMSDDGQIVRTPVEDISTVGRNTMGVIVMDLDAGDSVASVDVIPPKMTTEDEELDEDADDAVETGETGETDEASDADGAVEADEE
jgi:DNA gyrase subunit A